MLLAAVALGATGGLARLGVLFTCRWGGLASVVLGNTQVLFLWDIKGNYLFKVRERGLMVPSYINGRLGFLGSLKNITELSPTPHKQRIEIGASLST